jgi:hypothetical protein
MLAPVHQRDASGCGRQCHCCWVLARREWGQVCLDCTPEPLQPFMATTDSRRQAMVDSLRSRYEEAEQEHDTEAKQALFKEAVYLGIQPEEFTQAR